MTRFSLPNYCRDTLSAETPKKKRPDNQQVTGEKITELQKIGNARKYFAKKLKKSS